MHVVVTTTQLRFAAMHRVRQRDLPFEGHSHDFGGADTATRNCRRSFFDGPPESGPKPHRHPHDEVLFIREGRARYVVAGEEFEAEAGDILVVKAGEVHSFTCIGDTKAIELDLLSASTTQKGVTLLTYGRR
jgi:quercetin dioxygenase-like cupin family protein